MSYNLIVNCVCPGINEFVSSEEPEPATVLLGEGPNQKISSSTEESCLLT